MAIGEGSMKINFVNKLTAKSHQLKAKKKNGK